MDTKHMEGAEEAAQGNQNARIRARIRAHTSSECVIQGYACP